MTTGQKIRKARIERRMTQRELADIVGLPCDRVRHCEYGNRKPKMDLLKKFADGLRVDLGELIETEIYNKVHAEEMIKTIIDMYGKEFVVEILNKKDEVGNG